MRRSVSLSLAIAGALAFAAFTGRGIAQAPASREDVVAHEWGTFTSIAAEDGSAAGWEPLGGPQDLPCFVHGFPLSPKIWLGTIRMETPVVYFYASAPTTVKVEVAFRQGVISEWYPQASVPAPALVPLQSGAPHRITWPAVRIQPGSTESFPVAPPLDSHYYAARATDAAPIEVNGQQDRFLFYRGLAAFQPPIRATIDRNDRVTVKAATGAPLGTVILFQNVNGAMAYQVKTFAGPTGAFEPPMHDGEALAPLEELEHLLVMEGLYAKEAKAMVATWRDSWFEEGTRVFYVAPRGFVDDVLPLAITPAPAAVARVFVGRMEIVTADRLAAVESALASRDTASIRSAGRFLLPIASRLAAPLDAQARTRLYSALTPALTAAPSVARPGC